MGLRCYLSSVEAMVEWVALVKVLKALNPGKFLASWEKATQAWHRTKDSRQARSDQERLVEFAATTTQLTHAPAGDSLRRAPANQKTVMAEARSANLFRRL